MKRLIMILALCVPLMAQEAELKDETKDVKIVIREKHDRGDWSRGDRRQMASKRQKMAKKQHIRQVVRLVVVGGLAYYIGYHEGEKHFKGGMKRRPYFGEKK
jgi:hypothetical protein